ncbi:MAG: hypothetical protein ABJ013_12340 [Halioglobus sp.]
MIVTEHFVYIHTSRHAGSFINGLLLDHVPSAKMLRYHGQLSDLPAALRGLPVIGFVRNPWDWYVSMYFNYQAKRQYIFDVVTRGCDMPFAEAITLFLTLGEASAESAALRQALVEAAPQALTPDIIPKRRRPGLVKKQFEHYPRDKGYYSWLLEQMHAVDGSLVGHFGYFERMREDLLGLLEQTGCPVPNAMLQELQTAPAVNTSFRKHDYREYYSPALRDLVAEKDKTLLEHFNYAY